MTTANDRGVPPRRFEDRWVGPAGVWTYDRWGTAGRPILLIHSPLFDRTMWWPVAAEVAEHATVVAVDLPGHGHTAPRPRYEPVALVDELGMLVHDLGRRQAPIVVGHLTSALLASLFGERFRAHAVVHIGQSLDLGPLIHPGQTGQTTDARLTECLSGLGIDEIPESYRGFVVPHPDPQLLAGYARWRERASDSAPYLHTSGPFPHLADVHRFAAELRDLL